MRTLAIETASEACSIALFEGDQMVASDHRLLGRGHAEYLVPMIAALPDKGRADRILVSLGPGSFTGVRIGLASARALGVAWRADVLGFPTLTLIAAMAREHAPADERSLTVCMNGGHGEWFLQDFTHLAQPLGEVRSLTPEQVRDGGTQPVIAGNRAKECAQLFDKGRTAIELMPDARAALNIPEPALTSACRPIYGRAPDAKPQSPQNRQSPGAA